MNGRVDLSPDVPDWAVEVILPNLSKYAIYPSGRVVVRKTGQPLKGTKDKDGYVQFGLIADNGSRKHVKRHVLICTAFHGERPPGMLVRHLDGSRDNDVPGNLAWGTYSENAMDMLTHGTSQRGEKHGRVKITEEKAKVVKSLLHSMRPSEIARLTGVSRSTVTNIKLGLAWRWL